MKNKLAWFEAILVIAPFVAVVLFWNQVPARIPIHWNIHGDIDGWAPKGIGLLLAPILGLLSVLSLHVVSWLDPRLRRTLKPNDRMPSILQILRLVGAGFFGMILLVQIAAALHHALPTTRILIVAVLILFALIGNYLGNLRPNYFIGVRTPWTLENAETWRATHRLGARLMFFGAILLLIIQFFMSEEAAMILFVISTLLLTIWSFLYSWRHFRTHVATRGGTT